MEILQVELNDEQASYVFPPRICTLLGEEETVVYAAVENKEIQAAAVLTASLDEREGYLMNYVALGEEENVEAFHQLMDYIEEQCQKIGEKSIATRILADEDYISIRPLLYARGYESLTENGMYLGYKVKDILNTPFGSKKESLKQLQAHVKCYNELTKKEISQFVEKLKNLKKPIGFHISDLVFGRLYVVNDEIFGFMDIEETSPGVVYLKDTYVIPDDNAKYALPAMIVSSLTAFEALMPDDSIFVMQIYHTKLLESLRAVFGKASVELEIIEMIKFLKN